jgi:hypothetical protein
MRVPIFLWRHFVALHPLLRVVVVLLLVLVVGSAPSLIERGSTFIPCNCGTVLLP